MSSEQDLSGKIALVTGSSKGIGKGIALELGERGATVYLTARTVEPDGDTPGIAAAAKEIAELGGVGIPLQCDHGDDAQVSKVFERIGNEHGALDILVNNASPDFSPMVGVPFWEIGFDNIDKCLDIGPRSAFVATALAVRQMLPRKKGLVVNISSHGSIDYILSVPYCAGKAGIDKITADTALELRPHNIAVVSLWPGLVLTERIMARSTIAADGKAYLEGLDLSMGESPRFSGRAIAALANDPNIMERSGKAFQASVLAREYGFTDVGGVLPPEVRNLTDFLGEENVPDYWKTVDPVPEHLMTGGCPYHFPTVTEQGLDPDPLLVELLEREPVARVQPPYGGECWLVTRYDDVRTALSDLRFSREATVGLDVGRTQPVSYAGSSILGMDPPGHSRIRRLVSATFTARRVEQLRPHAREVVDTLLDEMEAQGPPADIVEGLALPLPITMICELLGVPFEDRATFRGWADTFMTSGGFTVEEIHHAHTSLAEYLRAMVHERVDVPTPDLLSALVAVRADDGDKLSEDELVNLAMAILVAGFETTASQLSKFVYWLLMHPDELDKLRARPELVPNAIEELMRLISLSAGASMPYVTTGEVTLSGVTIPAGETVMASGAAANRDPAAYPDPARYDVERDAPPPHLGFGHGTHYCLGAHLARMEMQVGLEQLINRFPDLALAVPAGEVPWKTVSAVWGLEALPVTF